jgi:hypothetical protein
MELSYAARRILGNLPVWHPDEAWLIEQEGGPEQSVRSYSLPALTARLLEDRGTPDMDEAKVAEQLGELAGAGLCEEAEDGWRMTQFGFEVLTDPTPVEDREPGPALIELHPAEHVSEGVSA